MPGDFGQAPIQEATVVAAKLVSCSNCGGHAPAQAANCPACRWPIASIEKPVETRPSMGEMRLRKAI